ncbi:MAG: phosphoenolpyruvate synthase [Candidatus Nanohaloarchaea archaeon]|nr:phosphoenolpyruvate synthase [Candidatus Nanohaloarchaea archaeon]
MSQRSGEELVLDFEEIGAEDSEKVGGKSANLGELARNTSVPVLPGFTTTSKAFDLFIEEAGIQGDIRNLLGGLDPGNTKELKRVGRNIRKVIKSAEVPEKLKKALLKGYRELSKKSGKEEALVAVRSSATAEDLPGASFAGQQETFLNVEGERELIESFKGCVASLFTDRAISYREDKGFSHFDVKLSVAVQKMGKADTGSAGVAFSIDPDSGFENAVIIDSSYGLGDYVVQGKVNPDRFVVFKPSLGILSSEKGEKSSKLVREGGKNVEKRVPEEDRNRFSITEKQVLEIAEHVMEIEEHYGNPMDVEWLLDGDTGEIYIVQARPETVHSSKKENVIEEHRLEEESEILAEGTAIGFKIGSGNAKVLESPEDIDRFEEGEVLVTGMTNPDWEPIMKKASAIITDRGGATSHAAIVSRELGVPAVVGTETATEVIESGKSVTVDCTSSSGRVWKGELKFEVEEHKLDKIPETDTDIQLNLGQPSKAFNLSHLPVKGVGLAREEFIIASEVGVHPLKLVEEGRGEKLVEALREGIGTIAAAFYPEKVVVRLSDFKSDEYADLKGGGKYEDDEANPMIGFRGASRYYDEEFSRAFKLECKALRRCIDELGLDNIVIMVPFCRTVQEGTKVREQLRNNGLDRGDIEVYVMAEVPSNIIRAEEFADVFDGFSIGTNDLTQLTLGIDRNSEKLADIFDERDPAVKRSVEDLIEKAHRKDRPVGICGDAPSSHKEYAEFLVKSGIDSISVSPDVALKTILKVADAEGQGR